MNIGHYNQLGPRGRPMPPMGMNMAEFNPLRGPVPRGFRNDPMLDEMLRREALGPVGGPYIQDPIMRGLDPLSVQAKVIVIDPERRCREYAEMILGKLKRVGLICDIIILDKFMSPSQVIDDVTARGLLYTASVNLQNAMHQSITINILQGQPQEHRNMPFEDALKLVARNFDAHLLKLTDSKSVPTPNAGADSTDTVEEIDPALSLLLINLAEGKSLRLADLDKVLKYLKDKRDKLTGGSQKTHPSYEQSIPTVVSLNNVPKPVQPPMGNIPSLAGQPQVSTKEAEDLQAKITKLFGDSNKQQSTVGGKPTSSSNNSGIFPASNSIYKSSTSQSDQKKTQVGIDFSNPTVQNALQNLMKTGPNILESIRNTTTSSALGQHEQYSIVSTATSYSGGTGYPEQMSQSQYGSKGTYSQASSTQQQNFDSDNYNDSQRPVKRAKPGRHAIAGFY